MDANDKTVVFQTGNKLYLNKNFNAKRKALCFHFQYAKCPPPVESSPELPLFEERPHEKFDAYYCGCKGGH